ncbi:hypothetical protein GPECTOR_6g857 [Gonium pectorale]|uniref:Uncharacterized protein n=1 Tax=Gonium pectorale TaxID=33097 RepID=A0A150GVS2_GONPE|nr:hypothetical protein GPECTOR_6g857 [Gonium pectorale]|eukprot:KXZ53939.1 hypothetical protein GPECTOR_6g857 [Gonium pectorale]
MQLPPVLQVARSPKEAVELLRLLRAALGGPGAELEPRLVWALAGPHAVAAGTALLAKKATREADNAWRETIKKRRKHAVQWLNRMERMLQAAEKKQQSSRATGSGRPDHDAVQEARKRVESSRARLAAIDAAAQEMERREFGYSAARLEALEALALGAELARSRLLPPPGKPPPPPAATAGGCGAGQVAGGHRQAAAAVEGGACGPAEERLALAASARCPEELAWLGIDAAASHLNREKGELRLGITGQAQLHLELELALAAQAQNGGGELPVPYVVQQLQQTLRFQLRHLISHPEELPVSLLEAMARRLEAEEKRAGGLAVLPPAADGGAADAGGSDGGGGPGAGPGVGGISDGAGAVMRERPGLEAASHRGLVRSWLLGLLRPKVEALLAAAAAAEEHEQGYGAQAGVASRTAGQPIGTQQLQLQLHQQPAGVECTFGPAVPATAVPAATALGLVQLAGEMLRRAAPSPGTAVPPPELHAPAAALLTGASRLLVQLAPPDLDVAHTLACQFGLEERPVAHPLVLDAMARGAERGAREMLALLCMPRGGQPEPPSPSSPSKVEELLAREVDVEVEQRRRQAQLAAVVEVLAQQWYSPRGGGIGDRGAAAASGLAAQLHELVSSPALGLTANGSGPAALPIPRIGGGGPTAAQQQQQQQLPPSYAPSASAHHRAAPDHVPYEGRMLMALQLLDMGAIAPVDAIELLRSETLAALPRLRDPDRLARLVRLIAGAPAGAAEAEAEVHEPPALALQLQNAATAPVSSAPAASLAGEEKGDQLAVAPAPAGATLALPPASGAGTGKGVLVAAAGEGGGTAAAGGGRAAGRVAVLAAALPALAAESWVPLEVLRTICAAVHAAKVDLADVALDGLTSRLLGELAPEQPPAASVGDGGGARPPTLAALASACRDAERESLLDQVSQVWLHQVHRRLLRRQREEVHLPPTAGSTGAGRGDPEAAEAMAAAETAPGRADGQQQQPPAESQPLPSRHGDGGTQSAEYGTRPPGPREYPHGLRPEEPPRGGPAGAQAAAAAGARDWQVGRVLMLLTDPAAARPLSAAAGSPAGPWPLIASVALRADVYTLQRGVLADRLVQLLRPPVPLPPAANRSPTADTAAAAAAESAPAKNAVATTGPQEAHSSPLSPEPQLPPQLPLPDAVRLLATCMQHRPAGVPQAEQRWAAVLGALLPPLAVRRDHLAALLVGQQLLAATAARTVNAAAADPWVGTGGGDNADGEWGPSMLSGILRALIRTGAEARGAQAPSAPPQVPRWPVGPLGSPSAQTAIEAPLSYSTCLARHYGSTGALRDLLGSVLWEAVGPLRHRSGDVTAAAAADASPLGAQQAASAPAAAAAPYWRAAGPHEGTGAAPVTEAKARLAIALEVIRAAAEVQRLAGPRATGNATAGNAAATEPVVPPLPGLDEAAAAMAAHWRAVPLDRLLQYGRDAAALGGPGAVPAVVPLLECSVLLPALRRTQQSLEVLHKELQAGVVRRSGSAASTAAAAPQQQAQAQAQPEEEESEADAAPLQRVRATAAEEWATEWRRLLALLSQANDTLGRLRLKPAADAAEGRRVAPVGVRAPSGAGCGADQLPSADRLRLLQAPADLLHSAAAALAACEAGRQALYGRVAAGQADRSVSAELVCSDAAAATCLARILSLGLGLHTSATPGPVCSAGQHRALFSPSSSPSPHVGSGAAAAAAPQLPSLSALERFRSAASAVEALRRRGLTHDGLAAVALRVAGAAFTEAAAVQDEGEGGHPGGGGGGGDAVGGCGGGGASRLAATAAALRSVAMPALQMCAETHGRGGDLLDGGGQSGHPLAPLVASLERSTAAILELAAPPRSRQRAPGSLRQTAPPHGAASAAAAAVANAADASGAAAAAAESTALTVDLLLALLAAGHVRGALPYGLAHVVLDSLDDQRAWTNASAASPGESTAAGPSGAGGGRSLGCLSAEQLEALLTAAASVVRIDRSNQPPRRPPAKYIDGAAAAAAVHAPGADGAGADTIGPTLGHQLLVELARSLAEAGALDQPARAWAYGRKAATAASLPPPADPQPATTVGVAGASAQRDSEGQWALSASALCRLAHALSRRGARSGLHGPAGARLLGRLYGDLVAETQAEADVEALAGGEVPSARGRGRQDAVAAAVGAFDSVDLLRLAACGHNLGDVALRSLAETRLEAALRRMAASRDVAACSALLGELDTLVREGDPRVGAATTSPRGAPSAPHTPPAAAARAQAAPYSLASGPATDVASVLFSAGPALAGALAELVAVGAVGLPLDTAAGVFEWAAVAVLTGAGEGVATVRQPVGGSRGADALPRAPTACQLLAGAWQSVVDRWLRLAGGFGSTRELGPGDALLLLAAAELLGCCDARAVQALSHRVEEALWREVAEGADAGTHPGEDAFP